MPRLSGATKERRREMLDARVDAGKALDSEKVFVERCRGVPIGSSGH